jgi:hypothetical protein
MQSGSVREDRETTTGLGRLTPGSAIGIAVREGDVIVKHPFATVVREIDAGLALELRIISPDGGEVTGQLSLYTRNTNNFMNACRSIWARLYREARDGQRPQREAI